VTPEKTLFAKESGKKISKMYDVIGIGDIDIDIYLKVDHIPGKDEKIKAQQLEFHSGGMVANFLVACSRLGLSCMFHGPVGADDYGRLALADLKKNHVDTSGVVIKKEKSTYFCVVLLDKYGEKSLIVAPTDCITPEPEDICHNLIPKAGHLHTTLFSITSEILETAQRNGLSISIDIEPESIDNLENNNSLLRDVDIVFVNKNAAKRIGQSNNHEENIKKILQLGPKIVCITMGNKGGIVKSRSDPELINYKAFQIPVVDTTGAGDCFAAGFVYGFLHNWGLQKTSEFASAVSAIKTLKLGGHSGAPKMDEVVSFLKKHGKYFNN